MSKWKKVSHALRRFYDAYEGRVNQMYKSKLQGTFEWLNHMSKWNIFYSMCLQILNIIVPVLWSECSLPGGLAVTSPNTSRETSSGGHPCWEQRQQGGKKENIQGTILFQFHRERAHILQLAVFPTTYPCEQSYQSSFRDVRCREYLWMRWPKRGDCASSVPSPLTCVHHGCVLTA